MSNVHGGGKATHETEAVWRRTHHLRHLLCQGRGGETERGQAEEPVWSLQETDHWQANCLGKSPGSELDAVCRAPITVKPSALESLHRDKRLNLVGL